MTNEKNKLHHTASLFLSHSRTNRMTTTIKDRENLELFYLIWLGNLVNPEFQQQLRTIVNYLVIFENEEPCLEYLNSLNRDERVIFIVKGRLGQQIVPQVVHRPQIHSIYVYSHEKKSTEQWMKNYKKVTFR